MNLPGVHAAPNIQLAPDVYEIENQALDPEGKLFAAMSAVLPWDGKVVLDLGAGTGYWVPHFHERAAHVIAIEPHDGSRLRAMARMAQMALAHTSVMAGSAERILLPDASVDVVHARFAYFFGPGCEPGLREIRRVIRPGGATFIIDNHLRAGTFAAWLRRTPFFGKREPDAIDGFWADHGFTLTVVPSEWRFTSRADLEAVVRNEFPPEVAAGIIHEHTGLVVEYVYNLYHCVYP
jgi:SAM-dependent methyltransferase